MTGERVLTGRRLSPSTVVELAFEVSEMDKVAIHHNDDLLSSDCGSEASGSSHYLGGEEEEDNDHIEQVQGDTTFVQSQEEPQQPDRKVVRFHDQPPRIHEHSYNTCCDVLWYTKADYLRFRKERDTCGRRLRKEHQNRPISWFTSLEQVYEHVCCHSDDLPTNANDFQTKMLPFLNPHPNQKEEDKDYAMGLENHVLPLLLCNVASRQEAIQKQISFWQTNKSLVNDARRAEMIRIVSEELNFTSRWMAFFRGLQCAAAVAATATATTTAAVAMQGDSSATTRRR